MAEQLRVAGPHQAPGGVLAWAASSSSSDPRSVLRSARIPHRPAGALAPLSFGQEQIWLHAQLAPEAPLYTESLTIRRSGPLDPEALVASFGEMVRRHESWRTTFEWSGNQVLQRVQPDADLPIRVADLRHLRWDERERAALRLAGEDLDRRIDLSREPGVQALLVTLSDSDHRLYLCLHHLIFDGISIYRVFLPELAWLYDAKVTGAPCLLKEPPLQYGDFAFWERRSANEELLRRLAGYWRERLAGAPSTIELPADHPRPPRQSFRGGLVRLEFPSPSPPQPGPSPCARVVPSSCCCSRVLPPRYTDGRVRATCSSER